MAKISIKKTETDPYINNVSLFLPFNSNFNDNSSNNFSVTASGNAQISSTQSKFGGSSAYFDGTGDYLTIEDNAAFNFNSTFDDSPSIPFTIEAWIYPLNLSPTNQSILISKDTYGSNYSWGISLFNDKIGVYTHNINEDWQFEANATVLTNIWQHVALSMDGTTQRLFLDGQLIGTKNAPITNASSKITIGCASWNNPNFFYNGYIDDLRITKGIAKYTSNFTNGKLNIKKIIEGSQVSSLSGLSLWLKADAGVTIVGGNVNTWADQSPNGNNATGPTMKKPTFVSNGINGKPAMSFNGTTQLFTINDSNSLDITNCSFYIVLQRNGNGTGNLQPVFMKNPSVLNTSPTYVQYAKVYGGNSKFIINAPDAVGNVRNVDTLVDLGFQQAKIMSFIYDGTIGDSYSNGIKTKSTNNGDGGAGNILSSTGTLQIGGSNEFFNGAEYFNGYISELIIFNRALNTTEHLSVTNYLNDKYAIYTSAGIIRNGKLKIHIPAELSLDQIFLRLESDKNITLNGSNVSAWGDLSGGTRNFSQATTNNQPIFLNGGLEFQASQQYYDGTADYMENTNNPSDINNITGPYTFAVVANLNLGLSSFITASSNNSYRRKLACYYYNSDGTNILGTTNGGGDGNGSSISNPPINIEQKNIIIIRVVSNTQVDYFINNNPKISQDNANLDLNPGITTPTPLYIGAARGFGGGGYNAEASWGNPVIYDLFLYNKSLTDSEVGALKNYLNKKHAIY